MVGEGHFSNQFKFAVFCVSVAVILTVQLAAAQGPAIIRLDGAALGRTFEGFGAVSGGGNTTRLLKDYPEAQQKEILDYLFQPNFGATLSVLKVEVGGDINSTEGSEPSHRHTRNDENYQRGFEWWLMEQAHVRNPAIALDCLAWGAPGWIGNGDFYSQDMMDYYIKFIKGAKRYHQLDITSVGGKNESSAYQHPEWFIKFRQELNQANLASVKLVACDDWGPHWLELAQKAVHDPELAHSIDVFAGHVTWSEKPGVASPEILNLGKPLWNTELHNYVNGFDGEISLVEAFNEDYIQTKITKITTWNLCWSYYPISSYPDVGMIRANTPWSGHFEILPVLWGYAHVNQFITPGWRFLENGGNGHLPAGGTYTTLISPNGKDFSLIAETKGAPDPQTVRFETTNGLSPTIIHIWQSTEAEQFLKAADVTADHGSFTITLLPNTVYTITTTVGQHKGTGPKAPDDAPLTLPYREDYQNYALGTQARYHYDYEGAFEIAAKATGTGKCLRQAAIKSKFGWGGAYLPLTFLGSRDWTDYSVSVDTYIEGAGAVSVHGRINNIPGDNRDCPGYTFRVRDTGMWELKCFQTVISKGQTSFSADKWHNLRLDLHSSTISGYVDGNQVCSLVDTNYTSGLVGLGSDYNFAQFGNLEVQAVK